MSYDTPLVQEIRSRAQAIDVHAAIFKHNVVQPWYKALDTLDPGAVSARAAEIVTGWQELAKIRLEFNQKVSAGEYVAHPERRDPFDIGLGIGGGPMMPGPGGRLRPVSGPASGRGHAGAQTQDKDKDADKDQPAGDKKPSKPENPTDPSKLPEVIRARASLEQARKEIGYTVGLQLFRGEAMLGASGYYYEPGPDPTAYVNKQRDEVNLVLGVYQQLAAIFKSPEGVSLWRAAMDGMTPEQRKELLGDRTMGETEGKYLSEGQKGQATALIGLLDTRMKYNFVGSAMRHTGLGEAWGTAANTKGSREHHKELMDEAAMTHDGRQGQGISAERIDEMRHDAKVIADEVDDLLYASDSKINKIIAKYQGREREMFFSLLERENVVDAMLKRGDTKTIKKALNSTDKHKGREYNASMDSSMTMGETVTYIGGEMLRQGPGAVCHFAAGVYNGLSHIPVIGGVFADARDAFRDLAKEADNATGAWKGGAKYRNAVAEVAGNLEAGLLMGGAGAEVAAVNTVSRAAQAGDDVANLIEEVRKLTVAYHSGKAMWDNAMTTIRSVPKVLSSIGMGDLDGAIVEVNSLFDSLIGNAAGMVEKKHTLSGKKSELKRLEDASKTNELIVARQRLVNATRAMADPDNARVAQLQLESAKRDYQKALAVHQGKEEKESAVMKPTSKQPIVQRMEHAVRDQITSIMITIAKEILIAVKNALVDALRKMIRERNLQEKKVAAAAADDKNKSSDKSASDLALTYGNSAMKMISDGAMAGADAAAEQIVKLGMDKLNDLGAVLLWKLFERLLKNHPEIALAEDQIKPVLKEVAAQGTALLPLQDWVKPLVQDVVREAMATLLEGVGYDDPRPKLDPTGATKPPGKPS